MKIKFIITGILIILFYSCGKRSADQIDLSGKWKFQKDSLDLGIKEKWFNKELGDNISLPGSMASNGKGNPISLKTKWTGQIVDSSWFNEPKYAKFRKEGNIKIPFWLQPEKHYTGAAWYQKEVEIPSDWDDKRITLTLDRPHWETQIWVNGKHVGLQNSLATAHVYELAETLRPGKNRISIRVDNRIKEIDPGINSHSITDHTQTNWNGIVGNMMLVARPKVSLEDVQLFPDIKHKQVKVVGKVKNATGKKQQCKLVLTAKGAGGSLENLEEMTVELDVDETGEFQVNYPMGESPRLWDEFRPNLYTMNLGLKSSLGVDQKHISFGMREFKATGKHFSINGRPVFLRGTLECAVFPKTGYPSTEVKEWKRILEICKAHGLNHMRFHSWCPPEAAFKAADELGVYLQVEVSSWANTSSSIGDGRPLDKWLYKEAEDILSAYGNHPSFVMMAYGNEPAGKNQKEYLGKFVGHFKKMDHRRVYTGGAGWPFIENADYYNNAAPRIQGWGEELNSIINSEPPQTQFDFKDTIQKIPMPYVSHEIGQWCVYPNFKEMSKYTGVLKPKNFEIFKETLEKNHMGYLADSLLLASGKLQVLCYKADIEAALRTKDMAGFQLLGLYDFPGQGTALVGVLDAFWEEKGYVSPEEYRRFCGPIVPLARLPKRIFLNTDHLKATVEVANFGEDQLKQVVPQWKLTSADGVDFAQGTLVKTDIPIGNGIQLGKIDVALGQIRKAKKLTLTIAVQGHRNSWDIWVYPAKKEEINTNGKFRVVNRLDTGTVHYLEQGGNVLLNITKGDVEPEKGGSIGVGFSSIFWNTAWTKGQKPHTLGILCDPKHPALTEFPTEYHSNWQWWDAMSHCNAIILDNFTPKLKPIVRIIDDWFDNHRTALIFEAKIGKGKLLVSGVDLHTDLDHRPEAQQMLHSLKKYMVSGRFDPKVALDVKEIRGLFIR